MVSIGLYILNDDGEPERCHDVLAWSVWMEASEANRTRVIAQDRDEGADQKEILVSTVFLGLDHNHWGSGPPVLWETMVFGGPLNHEMARYTSRQAALDGHQVLCQRVKAALG